MKTQNHIYRNGSTEPMSERIERLQQKINQMLRDLGRPNSNTGQAPRSLNQATLIDKAVNQVPPEHDPISTFYKQLKERRNGD